MNITVPILDREYSINCPPEAKDELYKSVAELQSICSRIQKKNPRASVDKILVTAAINIASQIASYQSEMEKLNSQIENLKLKVELLD